MRQFLILLLLIGIAQCLNYKCHNDQVLVVQSFGNDTIRMHCQRLDLCGYQSLKCDYDELQPQCGGRLNFVSHVNQKSATSPVEHTCCNLFNPRAPHAVPTHTGNDCFIYELPDGTTNGKKADPSPADDAPYAVLKNPAEIPEQFDGITGYRLRLFLLKNKSPPTLLVKGIERRLDGYRVTICRPRCTSYDKVNENLNTSGGNDSGEGEWRAISWSSWSSSSWSTWARHAFNKAAGGAEERVRTREGDGKPPGTTVNINVNGVERDLSGGAGAGAESGAGTGSGAGAGAGARTDGVININIHTGNGTGGSSVAVANASVNLNGGNGAGNGAGGAGTSGTGTSAAGKSGAGTSGDGESGTGSSGAGSSGAGSSGAGSSEAKNGADGSSGAGTGASGAGAGGDGASGSSGTGSSGAGSSGAGASGSDGDGKGNKSGSSAGGDGKDSTSEGLNAGAGSGGDGTDSGAGNGNGSKASGANGSNSGGDGAGAGSGSGKGTGSGSGSGTGAGAGSGSGSSGNSTGSSGASWKDGSDEADDDGDDNDLTDQGGLITVNIVDKNSTDSGAGSGTSGASGTGSGASGASGASGTGSGASGASSENANGLPDPDGDSESVNSSSSAGATGAKSGASGASSSKEDTSTQKTKTSGGDDDDDVDVTDEVVGTKTISENKVEELLAKLPDLSSGEIEEAKTRGDRLSGGVNGTLNRKSNREADTTSSESTSSDTASDDSGSSSSSSTTTSLQSDSVASDSTSDGTGSGSSGMNCFSGDTLVTTVTGQKRMDELAVGDFVLVPAAGNVLKYERVEMFYHREADTRANFVVLYTKSGRRLSLTGRHLLPTAECTVMKSYISSSDGIDAAMRESRYAEKARRGECVLSVDPTTGHLIADKIVRIGRKTSKGIYSPMTVEGSLVADGVLSSCFSHLESHTVHKVVFDFLFMVYDAFGMLNHDISIERQPIPTFITFVQDLSKHIIPFS